MSSGGRRATNPPQTPHQPHIAPSPTPQTGQIESATRPNRPADDQICPVHKNRVPICPVCDTTGVQTGQNRTNRDAGGVSESKVARKSLANPSPSHKLGKSGRSICKLGRHGHLEPQIGPQIAGSAQFAKPETGSAQYVTACVVPKDPWSCASIGACTSAGN